MAQGKTGSVTFSKTNYSFEWKLRISYSETYDVTANTSSVTITKVEMLGNWSGRTYNADMIIKVNNTTALTLTAPVGSTYANNGVYNGGETQYWTIVDDPGSLSPTPKTGSVTGIAHNADGTKQVSISIEKTTTSGFTLPTLYSQYGSANFNAGGITIDLTTIPRKSSFSTSGSTIGGTMNFTINRASSAFMHKLEYRYGSSGSWLPITNSATVGTSYSWTIPTTCGNSIPSSMSGSWQFKCTTYSGTTNIGETINTVTLYIPSSAKPQVTSGWASAWLDNTGTSAAGKSTYYTGISIIKVAFDTSKVSVQYGATAGTKNVKATYAGRQVTTTTGNLGTIGATSIYVDVSVTDARGLSTTDRIQLTAVQYIAPSLSGVSIFRCTDQGVAKDDGTYISIFANVNGQTAGGNSLVLQWQYKSTGSFSTAETITAGAANIKSGFAQNTSYTVRLTVTDMANSASVDVIVPTAAVAFNIREGGNGAAFGGYSQAADVLEVGWNLKLDKAIFPEHVTNLNTAWADLPVDNMGSMGLAYGANVTNAPTGVTGDIVVLQQKEQSGGWGAQMILSDQGMYYRKIHGGAWQAWKRLDDTTVITAIDDYDHRLTTADQSIGDNQLKFFHATGLMATNKPASDGYILQFGWDNSSPAYTKQLFIRNSQTAQMQLRGRDTSSWGSWIDIVANDGIRVEEKACATISSIGANSNGNTSVNVQKSGYTAVGIVGILGTGTAGLAYSDYYTDGINAYVWYRNTTGSAKSNVVIKFKILYIRGGNIYLG